MTLRLSSSHVIAIVKAIVIANIFLLSGTLIFNSAQSQLPYVFFILLRETDLASENVFAAWYSSILLLMSAGLSIFCFIINEQQRAGANKIWNFGWLVFGGVFAILSFDELGSIHEHIGNLAALKKTGTIISDSKEAGWVLFYIIVAVVSMFMLVFSMVTLRNIKWALIVLILGLMLYLSNPVQEYFEIEAMRAHAGDGTWRRPVYYLLLEEGSELFGSLCFLVAIMLYAKDRVLKKKFSKILIGSLVFFLLSGAAALLLLFNIIFGDVKGDLQNGVPKNWIAAALAFSVSVYCTVAYNYKHTKRYLLFAIFCLCMSIYFGCNRFAWYFNADYSVGRLILKSSLSALAVFSYLFMLKRMHGGIIRLFSIVSLLVLVTGIFIKRIYSAEIVFTGMGIFAIILAIARAELLNTEKEVEKII